MNLSSTLRCLPRGHACNCVGPEVGYDNDPQACPADYPSGELVGHLRIPLAELSSGLSQVRLNLYPSRNKYGNPLMCYHSVATVTTICYAAFVHP